MGTYCILRCPGCSKAKNVLANTKTARCDFCSKRFDVRNRKIFFTTDNVHEAVEVIGRLNSELAGNGKQFISALEEGMLVESGGKDRAAFDSVYQYIGYRLSEASGEKKKMETAVRLLTDELGTFNMDDLCRALEEANHGTERAEKYVEIMIRANMLFTKDGIRYKYIA